MKQTRKIVAGNQTSRIISTAVGRLRAVLKRLAAAATVFYDLIIERFGKAGLAGSRLRQAVKAATRLLPALSVLLILTTLVTYLTLGPATPGDWVQPLPVASDATESTPYLPPAALTYPDPDLAEYTDMNRAGYWDYLFAEESRPSAAVSDDAPVTPAVTSEPTPRPDPTARPTATPTAIPTATPVPLETDSSGIIQEPLAVADFEKDDTRVYIKVFNANIRVSPRTDAAILETVAMGDTLTRTGIGLYWSQVLTANGKTGYIYQNLISTDIVYKPKPTATPTPKPTTAPTPKATAAPTPKATAAPTDPSSGLTDAQKQEIVDLAKSFIGVRYVYGGSSPSGFDCSGLTSYIYKTLFGITLPRSAKDQASAGIKVSSANIEIGDIICFDWSSPYGVCDHVGIYVGGGQYVDASYSAGKVRLSTINFSRNPILTIRRIIH